MFIYSHNEGSHGAKALAEALSIKRIKHERSKFRASLNKVVINWGSSTLPPHVQGCTVKNEPHRVGVATDKLKFFDLLKGQVNIPEYCTDIETAKKWVRDGYVVVCRTVLRGSGGDGIVIAEDEKALVKAPLYTQYVKKKEEYRVHVGRNDGKYTAFDVQQKARKLDNEPKDWRIRNLENGFIYKREGVDLPKKGIDQAVTAAKLSGLDFCAIDLIYNAKQDKYYVLEANTAPGLEGTTLESYKNFLEKFK
jgi:glutathione synthase/RimK-type ligase-like ATP-grasp enzyme